MQNAEPGLVLGLLLRSPEASAFCIPNSAFCIDMRPRIFSLMLVAFALVIVLGVGGTMGIFWLAVLSFERGGDGWGPPPEFYARAEARRLAQQYERRGSWDGVEPRFDEIERRLRGENLRAVALVDAQGRVVRSSGAGIAPGRPLPPLAPVPPAAPRPGEVAMGRGRGDGLTVQSVPISLDGNQVGALVILYDGSPRAVGGSFQMSNVGRGFISAGVTLAAILLGLALLFSSRISWPLRQLNGAAQAMAAGDLAVRVRPPPVREVADLAHSFNRMADSLAQADRQRRQLTADVAHELRTPLSIIKGRLEGIQDGVYRAEPGQIDGLLGEVALLERLIDDLRLLALADAGELALYPEPVSPAHLVADARRSFAQQAEERGVSLHAAAPAGLPELSADPQRVGQVLGNLVANALRHTPAGGTVTVGAAAADGAVVFTVSDTGAGIAPEDLPRIFDRFYRADRSRARLSGGAGLGLAIARRIVEAHGGRIWAESEPGRGTAVRFTLPVADGDTVRG
jgi:two-component system OmpR family sensor kinase/two-component system sensor histidine kinase BaeS